MGVVMGDELSEGERMALAREVAADKRIGAGGWYNDNMREVFVSGWDAAMEYVKEQRDKELSDSAPESH